ncbi:MAG: energy transducer TonB [Candidatus Omnitrophica bacterium]|nr:energy transducer TonB [Candidatus Omnitrophota bacterium]
MNKELIVALIISMVIHIGVILFPSGKTKAGLEITRGLSSLDVIVVTASPQEKAKPKEVIGSKEKDKEIDVQSNLLQKVITGHQDTLIADANPRPQAGDSHLEKAEKPLLDNGRDSEKKDVPGESWNYLKEKGSITSAMPRYLQNPAPPYPLAARRNGYEGTTLLNVQVMPDGTAGEVRVFKSSNYEVLDKAAAESAKGWSFIPAKRMGVPVVEWVTIPVRFQLEEGEEKQKD